MVKKIIITGGLGYIGTELVNQLESNHIPYTGIDKNLSSNKLFRFNKLN